MKKIKSKIRLSIVLAVVLVAVFVGSLSTWCMYKISMDTLETTMIETASLAGEKITEQLNYYKAVAQDMGLTRTISAEDVTYAEKQRQIKDIMVMYGIKEVKLLDNNGKVITGDKPIPKQKLMDIDKDGTGNQIPIKKSDIIKRTLGKDLSKEPYVMAALKGGTVVTNPMEKDGEICVYVATPVWKDGVYNSKIIGSVVCVLDGQIFSNAAANINIGESGSAFIIDRRGTVIGHNDIEKVKSFENIIELSKTNDKLKGLSDIHKEMINGQTGFSRYNSISTEKDIEYEPINKFIAYAPINGGNGWSIGITAANSEFMQTTTRAVIGIIGMTICLVIAFIVVARKVSASIADPIVLCSERLEAMAKGDLNSPVPETENQDETGILISSLQLLKESLSSIIGDMTTLFEEISNGDFSRNVDYDYQGDFALLSESSKEIIKSLNGIMSQIDQSAGQVSIGSDQVSSASQTLSEGTTEQASAIQQLSATIEEISQQILQSKESASNANYMTGEVQKVVENGNQEMKQMIDAMNEISNKSNEIGKIIKTIDDIAFQTNILALNAAVEAARAGAAGKGFAVVADEVRNLASKSAEAAKSTTELIESSAKAVGNGTKIAGHTATYLGDIVESVTQSGALIGLISDASNQQAEEITQIKEGVQQISNVVQTNSATAEESAASSEELSGQAQMLKGMLLKIKLLNKAKDEIKKELTDLEDEDVSVEELNETKYE